MSEQTEKEKSNEPYQSVTLESKVPLSILDELRRKKNLGE